MIFRFAPALIPSPPRACTATRLLAAVVAGILLVDGGGAALGDEPADAVKKVPAAPRANRLAHETSPYLLLHAHNPVDWYPWGEEALNKARTEKKLIFLSIGYSSCFWCHVMERESFSDEEIAAYLNKHFVCIKVDREERPDIDDVYMRALETMGRRGGWPLSMFLTPEALPLFGGTYFPPRDKELLGGDADDRSPAPKQRMTGLITVLKLIEDQWQKSPDETRLFGQDVAARVRRVVSGRALVPAEPPSAKLDDEVLSGLSERYDPDYGGFGYEAAEPRRPKFPEPPNLEFLFDRVKRREDARAREMLLATLDHMAAGGIRDHVGGGFHRYSTDRFWRIPHFEKMLYDNAQLAGLYVRAFQLTRRDEYQQVAELVLAFVERELSDPEGGFYTALDAETGGDEGAYYVWTRDELETALGDDFPLAADVYGVAAGANFEGRSVLCMPRSLSQAAVRQKLSPGELESRLPAIRAKLLAVRQGRPRPLTDTKILTGFNGLMIRGFADAGRLLERPQYVARAVRAAEFVLRHSRTPEGRLLRTCTAGQGRLNAYLDDYAYFVDGLIALHQATGDKRWLRSAEELTALELELFWDHAGGGFFYTSHDHEQLFARGKNPVDSVIPSGNAVSAGNLVYLAGELQKSDYLERARKTVLAFSAYLAQVPAAMPQMTLAWLSVLAATPNE